MLGLGSQYLSPNSLKNLNRFGLKIDKRLNNSFGLARAGVPYFINIYKYIIFYYLLYLLREIYVCNVLKLVLMPLFAMPNNSSYNVLHQQLPLKLIIIFLFYCINY